MIITLSGLPGSGKSTLGKKLADALCIDYFYAGGRTLARKLNMPLEELNRRSETDPTFDRQIDDLQAERAKKGNVVIDGRISAFVVPNADCRIYLKASLDTRARRISGRDGTPLAETRNLVAERERNEQARYKKYYNIDLSDLTPYDIILDTSKITPDAAFSIIFNAVKEMKRGRTRETNLIKLGE